MASIPLFRAPPRPATASFGAGASGLGLWLSIAFIAVIVLAAALMFRDVIVEAFPGLAGLYAAIGLPVHAATFHG